MDLGCKVKISGPSRAAVRKARIIQVEYQPFTDLSALQKPAMSTIAKVVQTEGYLHDETDHPQSR